jgi:hypothetical protein
MSSTARIGELVERAKDWLLIVVVRVPILSVRTARAKIMNTARAMIARHVLIM